MIDYFETNNLDYLYNTDENDHNIIYPEGSDIEIFNFKTLEYIFNKCPPKLYDFDVSYNEDTSTSIIEWCGYWKPCNNKFVFLCEYINKNYNLNKEYDDLDENDKCKKLYNGCWFYEDLESESEKYLYNKNKYNNLRKDILSYIKYGNKFINDLVKQNK